MFRLDWSDFRGSAWLALVCAVSLAACAPAAAQRARPPDVIVFDKAADVPAGCDVLATVTASDGHQGDADVTAQKGSRDRALKA
jgi:hypothetical protein